MPGLTVEAESPLQDEVAALLRQSDEVAARLYPGEFRRPITPEALAQPGIHLVVARHEAAVGCCALFDRGDGTAELKRMIVGEASRGQGVGVALLAGAEAVARRIGAHTVVLEVGVRNVEAQALYRRGGYGPREPFPPYQASPISFFLERRLCAPTARLARTYLPSGSIVGSNRRHMARGWHMMLSHVHVGVSDFNRAFAFYSGIMEKLGFVLKFSEPEKSWAGWMEEGVARPLFLVGRPSDGQAASPGNGQMIALLAPDRGAVDQVHAWAIENGATDEGRPALRPHYHPDYYGAYFRDMDGNKICVCCHDPVAELPSDLDSK